MPHDTETVAEYSLTANVFSSVVASLFIFGVL